MMREVYLGIEWEMGMLVWEWEGMGTWNPFPLIFTPDPIIHCVLPIFFSKNSSCIKNFFFPNRKIVHARMYATVSAGCPLSLPIACDVILWLYVLQFLIHNTFVLVGKCWSIIPSLRIDCDIGRGQMRT